MNEYTLVIEDNALFIASKDINRVVPFLIPQRINARRVPRTTSNDRVSHGTKSIESGLILQDFSPECRRRSSPRSLSTRSTQSERDRIREGRWSHRGLVRGLNLALFRLELPRPSALLVLATWTPLRTEIWPERWTWLEVWEAVRRTVRLCNRLRPAPTR